MLQPRLIPVLLVKDSGLVKTRKFAKPVYVGDPINTVRIFNDKEADEIVVLDIEATARGTGPNFSLVQDVASECFMPLAYGGGIRDLADAQHLFRLGVEKVVLRSAAARDLSVVRAIAQSSGSQSVAVCVDLKRSRFGRLEIHAPGTPLHRSRGITEYLTEVQNAGAGEVVLNSVDHDGTMAGMDLPAISTAAETLTTPLLAVGGAGCLDDIRAALAAGATAVGAGSFFVFHGPRRAVLISYPSAKELNTLENVNP